MCLMERRAAYPLKNKRERGRKMRKTMRKIMSVMVAAALLTGIPGWSSLTVEAKCETDVEGENDVEQLEAVVVEDTEWPISPYTMLTRCIISVSGDSAGMHISIFTGAVGTASVIGIKDVKIQKKGWFGLWSTVATSSGGESYDRGTTSIDILYANAEKGATYRILCVHYADVNGYTEGSNDSGEFVFTY